MVSRAISNPDQAVGLRLGRRIACPTCMSRREGTTAMDKQLPVIYIARHGETAWTLTGQHTGLTDLPLTARGECNARGLAYRLKGLEFAKVFTSPLQRARRTCTLAGFEAVAEIDS